MVHAYPKILLDLKFSFRIFRSIHKLRYGCHDVKLREVSKADLIFDWKIEKGHSNEILCVVKLYRLKKESYWRTHQTKAQLE